MAPANESLKYDHQFSKNAFTSLSGKAFFASSSQLYVQKQRDDIIETLDTHKAENIVTISLENKSSLCDYMVIASAASERAVGALSDYIYKMLKNKGYGLYTPRGGGSGWVLIDTGDIIIHVFQTEVRALYALERMWGDADVRTPSFVD